MSNLLFQRRKIVRSPDGSVFPFPSEVESATPQSLLPLSVVVTVNPKRRVRRKKSNSLSRLILGSFLLVGSFLVAFYFLSPFSLLPSSIRLPIANVDISVPNATDWPLIHIVNTRFMQEQAPLTTLGMARLHLFWAFCFPTMIAQSTQQFLWIIKTDPQFASPDNPVFQKLVETVRPYPNIYLVASNRNFLISPDLKGSWRDGEEGKDLLKSKIYTGDLTRLHQAMALREERPVLETRLDADDGLHKVYLEYMQFVALKRFGGEEGEERQKNQMTRSRSTTKWLYWCTRRHLEWRSSPNESSNAEDSSFGLLNPVEHSKLCITPGITVGYNIGIRADEVPSESHDVLYKHLVNSTACYDSPPIIKVNPNKPACLDLVEDLLFSAIRSRTWTSAGMMNVDPPKYSFKSSDKLWQHLEDRFNLNRTQAHQAQAFLNQHKAQIAYENILGQCTSFHSCKQQAKEELEKYVESGKVKTIYPQDQARGRLRVPWR